MQFYSPPTEADKEQRIYEKQHVGILLFKHSLTVNDVGFVISEDLVSGPGTRLDHSGTFV